MAMGIGGRRRGGISEINMTPMIDVMLVLLIIFMVMQREMQRGLSVQVPSPEPKPGHVALPDELVLELEPRGRYFLNREPIVPGQLERMLAGVFAERQRKVLFVRGAESLPYGEVIAAVDASRAAGVQVIGLVPLPRTVRP